VKLQRFQSRLEDNEPAIILDGVSRAASLLNGIFEVEFDNNVPVRGFKHVFWVSGMESTDADKDENCTDDMVTC
jgi:hypothetical protein